MTDVGMDTDVEIIFENDKGETEDCFYENATEALLEIAGRLIRGHKVKYLSLIARVNFDFDKGVVGS